MVVPQLLDNYERERERELRILSQGCVRKANLGGFVGLEGNPMIKRPNPKKY